MRRLALACMLSIALGCNGGSDKECSAEARCVSDCQDSDGDGYFAAWCGGTDCDDGDPLVSPGAAEVCDSEGVDEDCDPSTFGSPSDSDLDGDGWVRADCCQRVGGTLECGLDCDDSPETGVEVQPGQVERCNGIDDDCNGVLDGRDEDDDRDGWADECANVPPEQTDCDDFSSAVNPGVVERCDGTDADCDGTAEDVDGDGAVAVDAPCSGGELPATDCDDDVATIGPYAAERCNLRDDDCDGAVDEAPASTTCPAVDGAEPACVDGSCTVETCPDGMLDCNGDTSDGCEVESATDADHCGACGESCAMACLSASCDEVEQVSIGAASCARLGSGRVACWGETGGDGAVADRPRPEPIAITDAVDVSVGYDGGCAVSSGGTVVCWDAGDSPSPTSVPGLSGAVQVDRGFGFACARLDTGRVECWGSNDSGQLGDGTTTDSSDPVEVAGLTEVVEIAAGRSHGCARLAGGEVYCWGKNDRGQIGGGTIGGSSPTPQAVSGLDDAAMVAVGDRHGCAVRTDGSAVCWGRNGNGRLGDGTSDDRASPVVVSGLDSVAHITAGRAHSCAVRTDGAALCWGANFDGQLGDGSTDSSRVPTMVASLSGAVEVAAGERHTCAFDVDRQLWCWGRRVDGRLGDGSASGLATSPEQVERLVE